MEFKNITKKVINIKVDGEWKAVEPNKTIILPVYVGVRQEGFIGLEKLEEPEEPEKELEIIEQPEMLEEEELEKLTKDGLNDYAAKIGLEEVKSSMKKSDMIEAILEYQNEDE